MSTDPNLLRRRFLQSTAALPVLAGTALAQLAESDPPAAAKSIERELSHRRRCS